MAERVLVVDPSADGRSYLGHVMAGKGYDVHTADSLRSARRAMRDGPPRAVVAVVGQGGADGLSLGAGVVDVLDGPLDRRFLGARMRALARPRSVAEELALREETTRALGLAEAPALAPTLPGRIAIHAARPADGEALRTRLRPHLSDVLSLAGEDGARAPDVGVLILRAGDDLDGLADLRARLQQTRLLALLPEARGAQAASALDLGADDVGGAADDPAETALRLQALVRQAQDRARCNARLADGLAAAHKDALTGLWNRRYAEPHLARMAQAAAAGGHHLSVLALDLDHFKAINDRWGHPAGDAVLAEVARRLGLNLRVADLLARTGGEEFLIALPDTAPQQARAVAERLCAQIAARPVTLQGGARVPVTVSIGLAHLAPVGAGADGAAVARRLVAAADRALYRSKADGRARVTVDA